MAITIHQQPGTQAPGFNDLIYVVSSTQTGQSNFQYLCDIYLTDDTGSLTHNGNTYLREKTPVDPIYSSGVFNISNHIKNFLSYDIHGSSGSIQKCPNSVIQVVCKFGEEYGASSAVTQYADQATATTVIAWNGVFDFIDFKNFDRPTWATGATTRRFLTNRIDGDIIRTNENAWLYSITDSSNSQKTMYLRTYDNAGAILNTFEIDNAFSAITTVGRYMYQYPAGTKNINEIPENDISGAPAVQPMIDGSVVTYDIWTANSGGTQTSEKQTFTINSDCTNYDIYRLHFLNKLGGFDSFSFTRAHTFETEVKREKFKRNTLTRIGGGNYGYNKYDLSDVQYLTTNKDTIKLNSDWIREAQSTWLEELITSPVVFYDDPTNGLVSVNVMDSKHTRKQNFKDGLFNLEITIQFGYDRYRQTL